MPLLAVLAHHSEPTDPTLLDWLLDLIESIFGSGPVGYIAVIGLVLAVIPATILILSARARRRG